MSSLVACPGCKNQLTLPGDFAGQRVQCPNCHVEFAALSAAVPAMEVEPPAAAPPPPDPLLQTAYAPTGSAPSRATPAAVRPTIYCMECGTKFPNTEDACPNCGHRIHDLPEVQLRRRRRPPRQHLQPTNGLLPVLGAFLLPLGAVLVFVAFIVADAMRREPPAAQIGAPFLFLGMGSVSVLVGLAFCVTWLYQAWRIVLRGDEEYSAGLMVGLLFVPVFNFYWMFRAVLGLSAALSEELQLLAPHRPHSAGWGPALVACIVALIPFPFVWPIALCMFIAWMLIANNAVNRLVRLELQLRDETE